MTHSIMALYIKTLSITTLNIMTLDITALGIKMHNKISLNKMG